LYTNVAKTEDKQEFLTVVKT